MANKVSGGDLRERTMAGEIGPSGQVFHQKTSNLGDLRLRKDAPLLWRLKNWIVNLAKAQPARIGCAFNGALFGAVHLESKLSAIVIHKDGSVTDYGVISRRVVTTAGVNYLVDTLQNLTEPENLKYHGFGSGTNAEASSDTTLQTEFTTEYATDNVRPTGTTTEGASANIYRTVATFSPDSNVAVTEHGIFSQAATGGGTLLDRSKFSVINLVGSADSLQTTYELTLTAGS